MNRSVRAAAGFLLCAICVPAPMAGQATGQTAPQTTPQAAPQAAPHAKKEEPSIGRVQVLGTRNVVEIEIESSDRLVPKTQLLTGPDRLVVDFANAVPGVQLRNQTVNRPQVKRVRVGLLTAKPPVTRVVLDLNGPQRYQVFPNGRTVIVKVGADAGAEAAGFAPASGPALVNTSYPPQPVQMAAPEKPSLEVAFQDGMLTINSNKANLSEVLFAVHVKTGAEIAIPAGAEQEQVVGGFGPAPAPEVLAHLLNGSKFNFLILSSSTNPGALDRVILSSRPEGPMPPPSRPQAPLQPEPQDDAVVDVRSKTAPPDASTPPPASPDQPPDHQPPPTAPDKKNPPDGDVPN
jgi:hypothetical protein